MKQTSLGLNPSTTKTRRREFGDEMECVVSRCALVAIEDLARLGPG
jgi:hypothetical protein